jgi:hypothetical protein
MQNYWLGVMAAAFVIALAVWLSLVFYADKHPQGRPQNSLPRREVIGGEFEARDGGRQLMPIPGEANLPTEGSIPAQAGPAMAGEPRPARAGQPATSGQPAAPVPEASSEQPGMSAPRQREAPEHEQAQTQADRP